MSIWLVLIILLVIAYGLLFCLCRVSSDCEDWERKHPAKKSG